MTGFKNPLAILIDTIPNGDIRSKKKINRSPVIVPSNSTDGLAKFRIKSINCCLNSFGQNLNIFIKGSNKCIGKSLNNSIKGSNKSGDKVPNICLRLSNTYPGKALNIYSGIRASISARRAGSLPPIILLELVVEKLLKVIEFTINGAFLLNLFVLVILLVAV